jgi:hypothetical protein
MMARIQLPCSKRSIAAGIQTMKVPRAGTNDKGLITKPDSKGADRQSA